MKIGIVTFHRALNYGAVLQAFALQTFLYQKGHAPFIIDHHHGSRHEGVRKYIGRTFKETLARWTFIRREIVFLNFGRRYLFISKQAYVREQDLIDNPPVADAYISGSDQIWNPNFLHHRKDERAFLLEFGMSKTRRIAYAASFGVSSLPPDWSFRFAQHLKRYNYVSIREKNALSIVAKLGYSGISWVPDPTLLLSADDYQRGLRLDDIGRNVVFSYIIHDQISDCITQTREYVCKRLSIPYIETFDRSTVRILIGGVLNPCKWLSLLKNSHFVVTNSYHGTVFSILFERPFIVLPIAGDFSGMNGRIESLLECVGLEGRLLKQFDQNRIEEICAEQINWDSIKTRIKDFSAIGSAFLENALSSQETETVS